MVCPSAEDLKSILIYGPNLWDLFAVKVLFAIIALFLECFCGWKFMREKLLLVFYNWYGGDGMPFVLLIIITQ